MVLGYAYCNVSVLPVRAEPYHTSEQTTQLLFGEKVELIEINKRQWAKIRCAWDDYIGWCKVSQITIITKKDYRKETKYVSGNQTGKLLFSDNELPLPMGSELFGLRTGNVCAGYESGKFKGVKLNPRLAVPDPEILISLAKSYLNAPYLWGGRSIAGIDCSGLVQMIFKLCNIRVPRDASIQAEQGSLVDFLIHGKCGDLAFFEEKEGQINHVGMLLDSETIIHATDTVGRVVIDRIDQGGIISISLKKRTHHLRMVKRILNS